MMFNLKNSFRLKLIPLVIGMLLPLCLHAQQVNVTGVVKDIFGMGIPGASVIEKGTSNGTIAGVDGTFSI